MWEGSERSERKWEEVKGVKEVKEVKEVKAECKGREEGKKELRNEGRKTRPLARA